MKIFLKLILFTQIAIANEYFIYSSTMPSELNSFQSKSVFSKNEKKMLRDTNVNTDLFKINVDSEEEKVLLRLCKSNKINCEKVPQAKLYTDQYLEKQWALLNDGRVHRNFVTDIDVQITQGKAGEDINIFQLNETSKKVKVAIIDSGLDLKHPDLINQIVRNDKECEDLALYKKCMAENPDRKFCKEEYANNDNNGNGYPLDCQGWSFSDKKLNENIDGGPTVTDNVGHGTHVTGIVAAEKNDIGIQGVIQNVEIYPIQVGVSSASYQSDDIPADKIAKAVLYAIENNVEVINLSLGWRISQDSTLMREMIQLALSKNIFIVAAGGNDGHTSPVYPCSYEGVICVGAHNEAGVIANFSNRGFHIDLLAPGTNILSTWPTTMRSKKFTINDNYEYMSGTSQAAPYVTGVIAKLINLNIDKNEIKTRIYNGTRASFNKGDIKFGNVDAYNAHELNLKKSLIIPSQKGPALINWSKEDKSFLLKLKNISPIPGKAKVEIHAKNDRIQVINNIFESHELAYNEVFETRINIESPDDIDSRQIFTIKINNNIYTFQTKAISLIQAQDENADLIESNVSLSGVSFKSFENYFDDKIDLLGIKEGGNKTKIVLVKQEDNHYSTSQFLALPALRPVFLKLSKVDINLDNKAEYVVTVVENKSSDERLTKFFIFDHNLRPQRIEILPKNTFDNKYTVVPGSFSWVLKDNIKVPMWIGLGERDPSERIHNDPWSSAPQERRESRLYYLSKQGLKTITFPKNVYPIQSLYSGRDAKGAGKFTFITTNTYNFYKTYQIYNFHNQLVKIKDFELTPFMNLVSTRPLPLANGTQNQNAYFHSLSTNGDLRVTSIEIDENNDVNIKSETLENQGNDSLIRLLRYDGKDSIAQTFYELQNNRSSILSRVEVRRIKHHLLRSKLALYLPLDEALDFGSEFITIDKNGELYSPAQMSLFPTGDCSEIEVYGDSTRDTVLFLCNDSKKIIKIHL